MTRRVDDSWKRLQQTTFTNWVNNTLRGHRKTAKHQVQNLETVLQDGIILAQLLETVASPRKIQYNKNPTIKLQKIENLGTCLKFIEKEKIKLVNIGPEDIYNGNLKLIMGLIWTLIQRFQIRSTGRAISTKNAMLAWINTQIPDQNIKNFTTDWNNGVALSALVDRIQPGLCPNYSTLDKSKGVENCRLGMKLAEDKLNIPKVMEPEDLSHPDVDEISVMTYLSYFCKPANERLLKWVQSKIPDRNVRNFTTDWNNGINLACLVDSFNPGILPRCRAMDPHDALENLVQAMRAAEDHLTVKPVIKASEIADPSVDELNIATYLARFQYAKVLPQPHEVTCSGNGLYKAFVGRAANFEVDASHGGIGDLKISITGTGSSPVQPEINQNPHRKGIFEVKYVPRTPGKLTINVKWSGFEIPGSPFSVNVLDLGGSSLTGKHITGGQCARVGKTVMMEAKGLIDVSDLYVMIQHPDGHTEAARVVPKGKGEAECSYTPVRIGKDEIFAKVAGESIPGSPFEVKVVDPRECSVARREPPSGKHAVLNRKAMFVVTASEANLRGIVAEAKTPSGNIQELVVTPKQDGANPCSFTPTEVGTYSIMVACAGENIRGSPLSLTVCDPTKCAFLDTVPRYMQVGQPVQLNISTKGSGPGGIDALTSQSSILGVPINKEGSDLYTLSLSPNALGEATIEVRWNQVTIPHTPFAVFVCDASKCSAYGPGLASGTGKVEEPFEFTVQAKHAGRGELVVKPKGPKSVYAADIKKKPDNTYRVVFTTYEMGPHSIEILWGGNPIPNSPYKVEFSKAADASHFTATGDGLRQAIAMETAKCMLVGPESGLLKRGTLSINISGNGKESKTVAKPKFDPKSRDLLVCITDNGNGSYSIEYAVPTPGKYSLSILSDKDPIPGSPFQIEVLPGPDASKCKAFGHAIDNPTSLVVGKPLEFKVDSTSAGTGQLTVTATDSTSTTLPVFIAEGKQDRIHSIKLDPKTEGRHLVNVVWSNAPIPGSPFAFEVSDPQKVVILNLPDSASFTAQVGEPVTFAIDQQNAGKGEIKADAKLENGRIDVFEKSPRSDGTIQFSYTPKEAGKMELLLTFSGINLLRLPWICEIADPTLFQVVPPKEYGKQKEYVKFVIMGLTKKNQKNMVITSTHKEHNATVKVEHAKDGKAVARFTPKKIGQYNIEVKCANKHISGSPFSVQVANPDGCKITGEVPTVLPVGTSKMFTVNTSQAGPGELSFSTQKENGDASDCLDCEFRVKATSVMSQQVSMKGMTCGKCNFYLKWAGYNIPNMPVEVMVVNPFKCSFVCPRLKEGPIKQGENVVVTIDTSKGGVCRPEVVAKGPKAQYKVEMTDNRNGKYTATFSPWQDGDHTMEIFVGSAHINGSPVKFEVLKPVDPSKITISGPGLKQAIVNRRTEVTIFARESKLFERGILSFDFKPTSTTALVGFEHPEVECKDNGNGTYNLAFVPKVPGSIQLALMGEGKPITGSPFSIYVKPEPNAKMCKVSGRAIEKPDLCQLIKEPVELTVDSTVAGTGYLTAAGSQPDQTPLRVFATEEQLSDKHLHYLKFDPTMVGTYTLNVTWDDLHIPGSPFQIQVVDPSRCHIEGPLPHYLQIGKSENFTVKALGAGTGKMEAGLKGTPEKPSVEVAVQEKPFETYSITLNTAELGESQIEVKFGGHSIPLTPFPVSVYDPSKCVLDISDLLSQSLQVGVPFHFTVTTKDAGRAKLQVKPDSTDHQYTIDTKETEEGVWEVTCTPWNTGEQQLNVLWGDSSVPNGPVTFTISDPKKCIVSGLPDPRNFTAIIGEPIPFSVDFSKAGSGELLTLAKLPDGTAQELEREVKEGVASVSCTPRLAGKLELVLQFNGVSILPSPWICEVPDPTRFRVTPPKGYGKQKEDVKFAITGITEDTQNFSIKAVHPNHDATVKTEPGKDDGTVIVHFTAKQIGKYAVEVKLAGQHIDGSPFTALVANADGCKIMDQIPNVVHIGSTASIAVDATRAGPGELSCQIESLAGEAEVQPNVSAKEEEGKYTITFTSEDIGNSRVTAKWADYTIPATPFEVSFVDSCKVTWACAELAKGHVTQGEVIKVQVDCKEGGHAVPEPKASGPKSSYSVETQDNKDGSFTLILTPWQIGENTVDILWGGKPIPNTPIKFEVVKAIEARTIMASGDGLHSAIAGKPAMVRINTPEVGLIDRSVLAVKFVSESATEEGDPNVPTTDLKDNQDGTYTLTYIAPVTGKYELNISCEDQPIGGSPFTVKVNPAPNASKCKAFGTGLDKKQGLIVNYPVEFSVDSTEAGSGHLTVVATNPSGEAVRVFTLDEKEGERKLHHLKFDPQVIGHYQVEVHWEGEHIPGSPFDFNSIDPSKCKVNGLPVPDGTAQIGEPIRFTILVREAGEGIPDVTTLLPGDNKPVVLHPTPISASILGYEYVPTVFGNIAFHVQFGGYDIPGSPFSCQILDPSKFGITKLNLKGKYALVCELVSFGIQGKALGDEKLAVAAHGPSADLNVEVAEKGDGSYIASFVPIEPGSYEVFVECAGSHVSGSPFTVYVADPSKCQFLGDLPSVLQVGVPEDFVVKTRGAGAGELSFLLNNMKKHPSLDCTIENQGLDTYAVTLTGKKISEVNIDVQWAGYTITGCPFKVNICDANQCKAYGQALMSKKGKAGERIIFTVVALHAGKGKLTVHPRGPSAQYNVDIKETKESTYEVAFTPWEIGEHTVEVLWGNASIPKSPFIINIDNPMETNVCNATGTGLKHAIAGKPATFTIISSEIGLLEKNALKVSVIGVQSTAEVVMKDNNNGCYTVQYTAPTPGAYIASVVFYDRQIPGSPFKVNVVPGPDASKCHAYGPALNRNSLHIAGSPLEFYVDTSEGGHGNMRVYVQGPHDYHPKIFMADDGKGVFSIKFDAMKAGKYFVVVAWADSHIPGSPFKLKVHPAADASKVKAHGPGLENGTLGDTGQFTVETKHAGIGTLLIRVHGIKDSFKIEASPISEQDPRTLLAQYHPRVPGEYVLFIRWSGVHIPGSPFTVYIQEQDLSSSEGSGVDLSPSVPMAGDERIAAEIIEEIDASFAQQTPKYDMPEKKKKIGRDASKKPEPKRERKGSEKEKEKEEKKKKRRSTPKEAEAVLPKSPSGGFGPVAPSMKMKPNPSFQGLAQSYPPGYVPPKQPVSPTRVSPGATGQVLIRTPSGEYAPIPPGYKVMVSKKQSHPREGRSSTSPPQSPTKHTSPPPTSPTKHTSPPPTSPTKHTSPPPTSPTKHTSPPPTSPQRPAGAEGGEAGGSREKKKKKRSSKGYS